MGVRGGGGQWVGVMVVGVVCRWGWCGVWGGVGVVWGWG